MNRTILTAALIASAVGASFSASAQTTAVAPTTGTTAPAPSTALQRDVNQQTRIESGLQSGAISTREGAMLEKQQAQVDHLEHRELKDGTLSAADQARLTKAQNLTSREISYASHNNVTGNPDSVSSQREQRDVQRNVDQQTRIANGVSNGTLNNHEVSRLENDQRRNDNREYRAGRNGKISDSEQSGIQRHDNNDSQQIHRQRNDHQNRRGR